MVAFVENGERKVGDPAKRQAITNPTKTVSSIKRFMGETFDRVSKEISRVPYKVVKGENNTPRVQIDDRKYSPQEISAMVLQKMKKTAEDYLGQEVTEAVITVPAYFSDSQRQATKEAGQIAGLEVLRIINEPTAASLAYGLDKESHDQTILVYDLGGGTFDVSVLEIGEGVFEVKATSGNTGLGGDDWDQKVIDWLAKEFKDEQGVDLTKDPMSLQRLKEAAEKAKIELSQVTETEINLPFITATSEGPLHMQKSLSRSEFHKMTEDLLLGTKDPVLQAVKDAGIAMSDIDHVIMVGGSTRMPAVQELVKELTGKDPHRGVNPDEVVAAGAALQAGVLKDDVKDILLLDVTPLTLGIETMGGVFTKMIERNTTIPTRRSEIFTTAADSQPEVEVHVLQGEREMASGNKSLGKFNLTGIPPAPRGVPQIEVTFDIDANGIVAVSAKDLGTGKTQQITITGGSALPKDEIDQMINDAESHANEDRERREAAEARNQADHAAYQIEKQLDEHGDVLSDDEKAPITGSLDALRKLLEDQAADPGDLRSATDELLKASQVLGQKVYEASQQAATSGAENAEEDDVVEAEIVDEGEDS